MNAFIEPLILYAVLFFRIAAGAVLPGETAPPAEAIEFSPVAEIARIALYNIPSLALVWYLLLKVKSLKKWDVSLPGKKDILSLALALPCLVLIGLTIWAVSHYFTGIPSGPRFLPPANVISWVILILSCFSTAYLEESYFRFYLLSKREEMGLGIHRAVLISALLFSFCHIYEGPWGFLNAALSGILLAFIFLRFRSLHGIAFAHALYNVLVYVIGN
ncbi:MAG: CPBP family intramembrane metalloprotease [Treponema sp.]|jgi:membrane protease YdiL (CAAX protease family)|nr:CPBP family intramembrane metalloprotease [Treponema sp.]